MKKLISVLLAVVMMFSAFTVGFMAFAEEEGGEQTETGAPEITVDDEQLQAAADAAFLFFLDMTYDEFMALEGDAQWEAIQKMDMDKVILLAKTAKIVLKFATVAIKLINVLDKLGIIDVSEYKQIIVDLLVDTIKGIVVPEEQPAPEESDPADAQPVIA